MTENTTNIIAPNTAAMQAAAAQQPPTAQEAPALPVLDPVAYHGALGEIVQKLAPNTEAHPAAMLVQMLVAFGNIVGPDPHLSLGTNDHPARINALVVGQSSNARKGTSWSQVRKVLKHAETDWFKYRVGGGSLSSGEGLIELIVDNANEDEPPTDKRALIVQSEFGGALTAATRQGSTLSATVREAFDGGDLGMITKNRQVASGAHICIVGHITAEELLAKMKASTDLYNGFANRFLYFLVEKAQSLPFAGEGEELPPYETLGRHFRQAAQRASEVPDVLKLDRGPAWERWRGLYDTLGKQARATSGPFSAVTTRAEPMVLRMATIYALADGSPTVKLDHLNAAYAMWEFSRASAEILFAEERKLTKADRLLVAMRDNGGRLAQGEMYEVFSGHITRDELDAILTNLERNGRIKEGEPIKTKGRPKQVYELVGG